MHAYGTMDSVKFCEQTSSLGLPSQVVHYSSRKETKFKPREILVLAEAQIANAVEPLLALLQNGEKVKKQDWEGRINRFAALEKFLSPKAVSHLKLEML